MYEPFSFENELSLHNLSQLSKDFFERCIILKHQTIWRKLYIQFLSAAGYILGFAERGIKTKKI